MGIGDWGLGIGDWGLGPIPKKKLNLKMKAEEGGSDDMKEANKKKISSSNTTLKTKIHSLEATINDIQKSIQDNITDIKELEKEKNEHREELKQKTEDMKKTLIVELNNVEVEMKKHLSVQKDENTRLQKLITQLKGEKTVLMNKLIALQRRITDMENQVGTDDIKFL